MNTYIAVRNNLKLIDMKNLILVVAVLVSITTFGQIKEFSIKKEPFASSQKTLVKMVKDVDKFLKKHDLDFMKPFYEETTQEITVEEYSDRYVYGLLLTGDYVRKSWVIERGDKVFMVVFMASMVGYEFNVTDITDQV